MMPRLLFLLSILICTLAPTPSLGQDLSRNARWAADIDFMIDRLELTHPNLYANILKSDFLVHVDALKRSIPNSTDVELVFGIQELVARIRNAHTLCKPISYPSGSDEIRKLFHFYPVAYYPFEDGLYVVAAVDRYATLVGKKVLGFGTLTTDETMRQMARFVAADNSMGALANVPRLCLNDGQLLRHIGATDSPERITLRLEREDGTIFESEIKTDSNGDDSSTTVVSMSAGSNNPPPLYLKHPRDNYWFEYLPGHKALYLQINLLSNKDSEPFAQFCQRMFEVFDRENAQKLIIDVRRCPGGDHIELPLLKGILARPHIDRDDRLFLVIGRRTGSASQHLTSELESYTNVTLIGEPTASKPNQYGAMQNFTLPYSQLLVSSALDYFQDAKPADYSTSSSPDLFVGLTSADYRERRDPVMERIADYDSYARQRAEFKERMSAAYSTHGIAGFKEAFSEVRAKYVKLGFNMERLLYGDLDSWMGKNKKSLDDYVEYLKCIHDQLPDSIPVSYDLAYWMNERGNREEAKKLYRRVLELNPEHHHARWRLGLIDLDEREDSLLKD